MNDITLDEPVAVIDIMRRAVEAQNPEHPVKYAFEDHCGYVELSEMEAQTVLTAVEDHGELWMDYGILKRKAIRALLIALGDYQRNEP